MAIGGPVSFASGFIEGMSRRRDREREKLQENLRLQKEVREGQEAIAKGNLAFQKAQAEASLAESELGLLQQRRAQIMASPETPYKDDRLEGLLEKARERMADAHVAVQESQRNLQGLIADRDARIRSNIPAENKGWFSNSPISRKTETPLGTSEYKEAIRAGEQADTPENKDFAKEARGQQGNVAYYGDLEKREKAEVGGVEKSLETGRSRQGVVNEEKRQEQLFPLDKAASEQRAKQLEAQSAMTAASQEIQARQQQQQSLQAQMPQFGGGPGAGKGGGHGGLLGAIMGKGGGAGAPGAQGQPAAPAGPSGAGPTVGQALGPIIGRFMQMPAPQAIGMIKSVLGGGQPPQGFAVQGSFGQTHLNGGLGGQGPQSPQMSANPQAGGSPAPMPPPRPAPQMSASSPPKSPQMSASPQAGQGPQGPDWWSAHPLVPQQAAPQAPQSQGDGGIPTIDHPDKMNGLKPGSVIRVPDGSLRLVPGSASL